MVYSVPTPAKAESLSDAQIELLRALEADGQMTTTELATRLGIARSTVSNLVKGLASRGLISREMSDADYRSVLIGLSQQARVELTASDGARSAKLQQALEQLSDEERRAVALALPALEKLVPLLRSEGMGS